MAVRTAEVVYIGRPEDLLAAQAKIRASSEATSGVVGKATGEIVAAGDAAGKAAAEQARLVGASLNEQNAAYNHAARAAEESAAAQQAAGAKAAKAHEKTATAAKKAAEDFGKWGSVAGVALIGASVDMASHAEKAATAIANAGGTSAAVGKKIEDAFRSTSGTAFDSAAKIGQAYAQIAGELEAVHGHALNDAQALKVMTAAMDLADSTGGELTSTTEALGKVMLTFGLRAEKSGEAADILYTAAKHTGTSVEQLAATVDRMHGRLGALGPSLAETTGLMVELAKQGIAGRQSLSTLNGVFTTLIGGGKKTQEMAKYLGLEIFNSSHQFVGLGNVIEQLHPKFAKLTQESQLQAAKALFGSAANKQLIAIIDQGPAAFEAATRAVAKHGAAQVAANKVHEETAGKLKEDQAAVENLGAEMGEHFIPIVKKVADALNEGDKWLEKHKTAAEALGKVIEVVLGAAMFDFAVTKTAKFMGSIGTMVGGLKLVMEKVGLTAGAVKTADAAMVADTEAASGSMIGAFAAILPEIALVAGAIIGVKELLKALNGEANPNSVLGGEHGENLTPHMRAIQKANEEAENNRYSGAALNHRGTRPEAANSVSGQIMAFWESKGFSHAAAAGFVGNAAQESSLNPNTPGGGLYQQSGYPGSYGTGSVAQQSQHVFENLSPQLKAMLNRAKSPQEAARLIEIYYEKPAGSQPGESATTNNRAHREQAAAEAYGTETLPELGGPKAAKINEYGGPHGEILHETAAQHTHRVLMERKAKIENTPYVLAGKHLTLTGAQQSRVNAELGEAASAHEAFGMNKLYASEAGEVWGHMRTLQEAKRKPLSTAQGAQEQTTIDEVDVLMAKSRQKYYEREVKALQKEARAWGKLRDSYRKFARHAHGHAKVEALNKAAAYDGKVKAAKKEAEALHGTIQDAEAQVDEAQYALNTTLPAEVAASHTELQSGDLSAYQAANGKIDLEERAGVLTPEQAKAAREANANKALSGGYGELSSEGILQVKGDLKEFAEATKEATNALEAHTNALKESEKALNDFLHASERLATVENGALLKSLADLVSGRIGGVEYHGRTITAGAGTAARY